MRILFLDDDEKRHKAFCATHIGHEITRVWDVFQAKLALDRAEPFDYACLDHDLGGNQMVESGKDTGFAVAEHIAAMRADRRPRRVIVHSFNPVGALNMARLLHAAGVNVVKVPFGRFRIPVPTSTVPA